MNQPDLLGDYGALVVDTSAPAFLLFEVPGEPHHKGRHRARIARTKGGGQFIHMYPDPATAAYEKVIAQRAAIEMRGRKPSERPLALIVHAFKSVPMSWSRRERADALAGRILPTGKADWDNFGKCCSDAMNKIAYLDDAQIVDGRCIKRYAEIPGMRIELREFIPRI